MIAGTVIGKVVNVELVEPQTQDEKPFVAFTLVTEEYNSAARAREERRFYCVAAPYQHDWLAKQALLGYRVAVVFSDLKANMSFEASLKVISVSGL